MTRWLSLIVPCVNCLIAVVISMPTGSGSSVEGGGWCEKSGRTPINCGSKGATNCTKNRQKCNCAAGMTKEYECKEMQGGVSEECKSDPMNCVEEKHDKTVGGCMGAGAPCPSTP